MEERTFFCFHAFDVGRRIQIWKETFCVWYVCVYVLIFFKSFQPDIQIDNFSILFWAEMIFTNLKIWNLCFPSSEAACFHVFNPNFTIIIKLKFRYNVIHVCSVWCVSPKFILINPLTTLLIWHQIFNVETEKYWNSQSENKLQRVGEKNSGPSTTKKMVATK